MEKQGLKLRVSAFSPYPGPRYSSQGDSSGEDFYHLQLNEEFANAFKSKQKLTIDLDGTAGYASSFLDEAFGNLVFDFGIKNVSDWLLIESTQEPDWIEMINMRVLPDWETRRKEQQIPKKTVMHLPWYGICEGELEKKIWIQ
jgi:hypothetical protein